MDPTAKSDTKFNSKMEFKVPLYTDLLFVTVGRWRTSIRVGLRYFCKYESSPCLYPTKNGLNLYMSQWNILCANLKDIEREMRKSSCNGPLDLGMDVTASVVLVNHWLPVLRIVHSAVGEPIDLVIEDVQYLAMDDFQTKIEDEIEKLKEECTTNYIPPPPRPNTLFLMEEATPNKLFKLIGVSPLECEVFLKTISLISYMEIERAFNQDRDKGHCIVKKWNEKDNWSMLLGLYFKKSMCTISGKRSVVKAAYKRACHLEEMSFKCHSVNIMHTYICMKLTIELELSMLDCIRKYMANIVPMVQQNVDLYKFIEFINPITE